LLAVGAFPEISFVSRALLSDNGSLAMPDHAFDLVADTRCRLLMLGSFPGVRSLRERRYYAYPHNQFWQLMTPVVGIDLVPLAYEERLAALLARGVGLWDVVETARRAGSLDTALRDVAPRDLRTVAAGLPNLRGMAFNGATAFRIGRRQMGEGAAPELVSLPSSSPAHTIGLAAKAVVWRQLAAYLD
jgi:hypoxanthine-DNA glycosylase